jgi:hypothetical protein
VLASTVPGATAVTIASQAATITPSTQASIPLVEIDAERLDTAFFVLWIYDLFIAIFIVSMLFFALPWFRKAVALA